MCVHSGRSRARNLQVQAQIPKSLASTVYSDCALKCALCIAIVRSNAICVQTLFCQFRFKLILFQFARVLTHDEFTKQKSNSASADLTGDGAREVVLLHEDGVRVLQVYMYVYVCLFCRMGRSLLPCRQVSFAVWVGVCA